MEISRYVKFIELEKDVFAVFNTLFMHVIFVDTKKKNEIENKLVSDYEKEILFSNGIYIKEKGNDDKVFEIMKHNIINHSKKISIMYLNVSTYCNLACKYCFIDNNPLSTHDRRIMSFETAKNALDKFKEEITKNNELNIAQIILYGGEPLTNTEHFSKIVRYAREIMPNIKITLITNGTLLNKEIIEFLNNQNIIIGLSIDGPKDINDKSRVYKSQEGSVFDDASSKIGLLNLNNSKYGLSSTVTRDLINNSQDVIECFKSLMVHDVFFNLFHYSNKVDKTEWEDFYNAMSDFILDMNDKLKLININEGRIRDQLNLLSKDIFKFQSCGAVGLNQITIQPNGDVCICQGDSRTSKYVIGNINVDEICDMLKSNKLQEWISYYTVCREKCRYCEALFVCGGGCPLQSEALFGSRGCVDEASCIFYKKFLTWYLKKYYLKIKGGRNVTCSKP